MNSSLHYTYKLFVCQYDVTSSMPHYTAESATKNNTKTEPPYLTQLKAYDKFAAWWESVNKY